MGCAPVDMWRVTRHDRCHARHDRLSFHPRRCVRRSRHRGDGRVLGRDSCCRHRHEHRRSHRQHGIFASIHAAHGADHVIAPSCPGQGHPAHHDRRGRRRTPPDRQQPSGRRFAGGNGYDFKPIFAALKPLVSGADLAICQMEGTLSPDDTGLTSDSIHQGIVHHGPREFARDLAWTGYDGCSTANNHTSTGASRAYVTPVQCWPTTGCRPPGLVLDAATPGQPAMYDVKGVKVAQLSYSYNLSNGPEYPSSAPWLQANTMHSHTAAGIIADARAARAAGAQIVLVSMHWGRQFVVAPSNEQTTFATALMHSGEVDQIIGNHPHVVQACERINGRIVNYAFGNQVSDQRAGYPPATSTHPGALSNAQNGVVGRFTFELTGGKVTKVAAQYQVTRTDIPAGYVIRLVTRTSNPHAWQETTAQLTGRGNSCGLTPLS